MCVPSAFVLLSSCDERLPCVFLLLQFFRARGTDIAFLKAYKPVRAAAEYTRAAEFMKNDVVAVYIYLKRVLLRDVKSAAHLYWQHDSSQFVNFAHDSCRFHCSSLPKILLSGHDVVFRKGRIYPHICWHFIIFCLKINGNILLSDLGNIKLSRMKHTFICRHLSHLDEFVHYLDAFTNISTDIILYLWINYFPQKILDFRNFLKWRLKI